MSGDYAIHCPVCRLLYEPDTRIYPECNIYCPRCGAKLTEDSEEEGEE